MLYITNPSVLTQIYGADSTALTSKDTSHEYALSSHYHGFLCLATLDLTS